MTKRKSVIQKYKNLSVFLRLTAKYVFVLKAMIRTKYYTAIHVIQASIKLVMEFSSYKDNKNFIVKSANLSRKIVTLQQIKIKYQESLKSLYAKSAVNQISQ